MSPEELASWVRRLKREPLAPEGRGEVVNVDRRGIESLVPHRGSMLLVDRLSAVELATRSLRAHRYVDPRDPVFEGHFPDRPVYPGVLLVELMGQAALCLLPFLREGTTRLPAVLPPPPAASLTHVRHASFFAPVQPGDELTVMAAIVDDSFTVTAAGQVYSGDTLCASALCEVYLDE